MTTGRRRRGWLLIFQALLIAALLLLSFSEPALDPWWLAIAALLVTFFSASQDIVIDAYRIESAEVEKQAMMSATYIAGYRIGMLVAGAGSLYLADWLGSRA